MLQQDDNTSADAEPPKATSAATRKGMSALVAPSGRWRPAPVELNNDTIIFPRPSDDDAPLSPATDYDDENEEPLSPCGSDNGLLASEGESSWPSIARPTS